MTTFVLPKPIEWKVDEMEECGINIKTPIIPNEDLEVLKTAIWEAVSTNSIVFVICPDVLTLKIIQEEYYIPEKVLLAVQEDNNLILIGRCEDDEKGSA